MTIAISIFCALIVILAIRRYNTSRRVCAANRKAYAILLDRTFQQRELDSYVTYWATKGWMDSTPWTGTFHPSYPYVSLLRAVYDDSLNLNNSIEYRNYVGTLIN